MRIVYYRRVLLVQEVTTCPYVEERSIRRASGCARSVAAVYDLQHDVAHQELLTMPSPSTGQLVSRAYLLPKTVDDLARQHRRMPR